MTPFTDEDLLEVRDILSHTPTVTGANLIISKTKALLARLEAAEARIEACLCDSDLTKAIELTHEAWLRSKGEKASEGRDGG